MEEWQKETINQNLPELILVTKFNAVLKAQLQANKILSQTDVDELDAYSDRKGKAAASYNYYKLLMTRVGAYKVLTKILEENNQTGAARILKDGMRKLGILKELEVFNNAEINVQGKTLKLQDFFCNEKLELVQEIFRDTISDLDMYDSFVEKEQTFVLATSSIPPEPPFHIPRFLSNRIEVSESLFKADCPDVFVFKNTIPRHKLSEIAKPHSTDTSTSQLTKITCRFILLDEIEDWYELKKSAKVPIHLIHSDTSQQVYLLEDTTGALDILSKVGSKKQRIYLSEDEFVQQQLSENVSSVCICDLPGMGKTFLLANIARAMSTHCIATIVAFIQLSTFVEDLSFSSTNTKKEQDEAFLNVLKNVSPSRQHAEVLFKLVEANLLQVQIFFDGFDEISTEKLKCMKQFILFIKTNFQNVTIYITSRPHMRNELEKSLGVIAYDILPFNIQNQVNFMVRFWSPNLPKPDKALLENYAQHCLREINQILTKDDKEMAGIPLLCRLIAEVYVHKVNFYSTTGTKNIEFPLKLAGLYQQFVEQRIKAYAQNEDGFMNVKLVHIWHALKLLFPTDGFHDDEMFTTFNQEVVSTEVLRAGIVQLQSNTKLEFIHRTFAEYFAAEFFSGKLQSEVRTPKAFRHKIFNTNKDIAKIFSSIIKFPPDTDYRCFWYNTIPHSVVVRFVDFSLNEVTLSEEIISRVASSISTKKFLTILCSCCQYNLYNLFSVLSKSVSKWNWYQKKKYFTKENCFELLNVCIRESSSQIFRSCAQFLAEVLQFDLDKICLYKKYNTSLHTAATYANYEAFEYLMNIVSVEPSSLLFACVFFSNSNDLNMIRRKENILHLLLNRNPTLPDQTPKILLEGVHVKLLKILVQFGANLTAANNDNENCAMIHAKKNSSSDFHELVQFVLSDCKAEYLFLDNEKWSDPLPCIIKRVALLPETLELLLNIPRTNINMKDKEGENLLFSAVRGNKVNNFQQLVNRGLDHKARGTDNQSLLHVAAFDGNLELIHYLLSLRMDPNSRDINKSTPLHFAAFFNKVLPAEILVENGASVNAKNLMGQTPLHYASGTNDLTDSKTVQYLIRKGARVNDRDNTENTPLHICKWPGISMCMLEMGADVHAKNKKGETPKEINRWVW